MTKKAVTHSGPEARGPAQARDPGQWPTSPMTGAGSGYLQDEGKNQLAQIWDKITSLSP